MNSYDRLYGKLEFPPIIRELLDCPGLLRLREVRMANIPFLNFPSFAAVSRYEHSLGVCYLAGLCADSLKLNSKDKLELMIACLYHDVGTPAFAHAVEEVLQLYYNFDHEIHLRNLITGETKDLGRDKSQVFLGRGLKLHKICQKAEARSLGIDLYSIADIVAGSSSNPISNLVNSSGLDLDNIDNVIRAATAMGIKSCEPVIAIRLAKLFVEYNNEYAFDATAQQYVLEWQKTRKELYSAIFSSVYDFAFQTMLKHAIHTLIDEKEEGKKHLREDDWKLTDEELVQNRLMEHPKARHIFKRIRLAQPYLCQALLYIKGKESMKKIPLMLKEIEKLATKYYNGEYSKYSEFNDRHNNRKGTIIANFFLDKRIRDVGRSFVIFNQQLSVNKAEQFEYGTILGIFSESNHLWTQKDQSEFINELNSEILFGTEISNFIPPYR